MKTKMTTFREVEENMTQQQERKNELEGKLIQGKESESQSSIPHDVDEKTKESELVSRDVPSMTILQASVIVAVDGGHVEIEETGVTLTIPAGALLEEHEIYMKVIPQPCDSGGSMSFANNSAVIVELLPNNLKFLKPVVLQLPHCLQLRKGYDNNSATILASHHEGEKRPKWEEVTNVHYVLHETSCSIYLHSFCWITYEVRDSIVEAKRIKVYTAGKQMKLHECITEVEVGFYPDLPGYGQILSLNEGMVLSQRKPYVFLKAGDHPLVINIQKVVPKQWMNIQPKKRQKVIPFESVAISEERSCPFVLEKEGEQTQIPICIFDVGQETREQIELTVRPKVIE